MKDAWVLRLKDEAKEEGMEGDIYFSDDAGEDDFLTNDLNKATIFPDKDKEIESLRAYEEGMYERFGPDAIVNFGYTNIMKNFDFVEVEIEEAE